MKKKITVFIALLVSLFCLGLWLKPNQTSSLSNPGTTSSTPVKDSLPIRFPKPLLAVGDHTDRANFATGRKTIIDSLGGLVYEDFLMHPFEKTKTTKHFSWTEPNLKGPEKVDLIVHNDLERERLLAEESYITQRQLVYQNITFQDLAEASLKSGESLETLILPGLDGQEFEVVVKDYSATNEEGKPREGHLYGHLKGDPESEVSWAYYDGVESGTVTSHRLGIHLSHDPREERQVVINEVDIEALADFEEFTRQEGEQGPPSRPDRLSVGRPNREIYSLGN